MQQRNKSYRDAFQVDLKLIKGIFTHYSLSLAAFLSIVLFVICMFIYEIANRYENRSDHVPE